MSSSYIRILQAILMLLCLCNLVSCQSRGPYISRNRESGVCNDTANATMSFLNNKNLLLSEFTQQSLIRGYYNTSIGDGPDRVYGYYLCRGDVSLLVCNSCIRNGTEYVISGDCPYVDGVLYSEMCIIGYTNHSTYGIWKDLHSVSDFIRENVSNYEQFNRTLSNLMEDLINEAAFDSQNSNRSILGFATMEANVSEDEIIYSLAQCTPDIEGVNCSRCLQSGLSTLRRRLADHSPAAYVTMNKCRLRYDVIPFYNLGVPRNVGARLGLRSHLLAIYSVVLLLMYYNFLVL